MGKTYELIIIGGGPAGITAGIYAGRQKLDTLLLTKSFAGQMARKAVAIENYPGMGEVSGFELIQKFENHLRSYPVEIRIESVSKVEKKEDVFLIITGSKKEYQSKTVIVASGADPRPLEVSGEKEFIGKGVSYCVACDGPLFAGKAVSVAGGGNSAFEAALSLSNYAKKVYILTSQVRAEAANQERVKGAGNIEVIDNVVLKSIHGKKFLESVRFEDILTKEIKNLEVSGIFVEIGSQPASSFVKGLVDFNEKDEIVVDPKTCQTKTSGLFAAGDVNDLLFKQIVVAAGEGASAAIAVSRYLQG